MKAGLPRLVFGVDVGSQLDQIGNHQVVVVGGGVEEGGLRAERLAVSINRREPKAGEEVPHHPSRVSEVQAVEGRHSFGDAVA